MTTWTSRISGTFFRTDLPGASNAATIALLTRFLAPRTLIVPFNGRPPTTCRTSFSGSTALTVAPYNNSHIICFNICRNGGIPGSTFMRLQAKWEQQLSTLFLLCHIRCAHFVKLE